MGVADRRAVSPIDSLQLPNQGVGLGVSLEPDSRSNYQASSPALFSPTLSLGRKSFSPTSRERHPGESAGPFAGSPSPGLPDDVLAAFRQRCVEFYYDNNPLSGKAMEATLRDVAPLQRKTLNTIQSSVRAQFHTDSTNRKRLQLQRILLEVQPGAAIATSQGISPASSIAAWRSAAARAERYRRLKDFVALCARKEHPGPHPLLRSLKTILLLQSLAQKHGGAGAYRIEWEIDDAVWMEGSGEDFARIGIELLKGVLGFEEMSKEEVEADLLSRQTSIASTASEVTQIHQALDKRPPPIPPPRGHGSSSKQSPLLSNPFTDSPALSSPGLRGSPFGAPPPRSAYRAEPQVPSTRLYRRTFVVPAYLTNPELAALSYALPSWLRVPARFPTGTVDAEQVVVSALVPGGHGEIRISLRPRDAGYGGTLLERLKTWFSSLIA